MAIMKLTGSRARTNSVALQTQCAASALYSVRPELSSIQTTSMPVLTDAVPLDEAPVTISPDLEAEIDFDTPGDRFNARDWPAAKKITTAIIAAFATVTAALASSIFSPAIDAVARYFDVSKELSLLNNSLFILGYAAGPIGWGPCSEQIGRRLPLTISMFGFAVFSTGCAVSTTFPGLVICRFFAGLCGSCPVSLTAAVYADMLDDGQRGVGVTLFGMANFAAPLVGPLVGGYVVESPLGWRWTMYIVAIMGWMSAVSLMLALSESYPPVCLAQKAAYVRRVTGNPKIRARHERTQLNFGDMLQTVLLRPVSLLLFEPIVGLLSIYTAFTYGLLYLFLAAYPLIFESNYGFTKGTAGLTLLGMVVGECLAGVAMLAMQPGYRRKLAMNHGVVVPEWRLPIVIVGAVAFAVGSFWFGWTASTGSIHWAVPASSGVLTGFGMMAIFLQSMNYLVDSYQIFSASALAANTGLRSLFAAGFPFFATHFYQSVGVGIASSILGGIAVAFIPVPILFYVYGASIRSKSKVAMSLNSR